MGGACWQGGGLEGVVGVWQVVLRYEEMLGCRMARHVLLLPLLLCSWDTPSMRQYAAHMVAEVVCVSA